MSFLFRYRFDSKKPAIGILVPAAIIIACFTPSGFSLDASEFGNIYKVPVKYCFGMIEKEA